jgi:5-methylcytosine-specific restriction protein A
MSKVATSRSVEGRPAWLEKLDASSDATAVRAFAGTVAGALEENREELWRLCAWAWTLYEQELAHLQFNPGGTRPTLRAHVPGQKSLAVIFNDASAPHSYMCLYRSVFEDFASKSIGIVEGFGQRIGQGNEFVDPSEEVLQAITGAYREATGLPVTNASLALPGFEIGQIYRRRDVHARYGGQRQGGIVTPVRQPFIFLITGEGGGAHGYADGWDADGTFRYYGEGQVGDMRFVRGNAALRDHAAHGRDILLFEKVPPAHVRYLGQMVCAGYDLVPDSPDTSGNARIAIVFRLVALDGAQTAPEVDGDSIPGDADHPSSWYWQRPLDELREAARRTPSSTGTGTEARRTVYHRSEAVRVYVLRRADGHCEGCAVDAPFTTPAGRPYLEPHHTRRISDGGPDDPACVIGLCPTCHRRAHYAEDAADFNEGLIKILRRIERAVA